MLAYTFAEEGSYDVSLCGKTVNISIKLVPTHGRKEVVPIMIAHLADPNQMMEDIPITLSHVTIRLPYHFVDSDKDLQYSPEIAEECIKYLNRLIEVIRYCTGQYWIQRAGFRDLFIQDIIEHNIDGSDKGLSLIQIPSGHEFKWETRKQSEAKSQILEFLNDGERRVPLSENLFLEALRLFNSSTFEQAVIIGNTSLEIFVGENLLKKYTSTGMYHDAAKRQVDKLFGNTFHDVMKKSYFHGMSNSELKNHEVWKKFDSVRKVRKEVIHPHVRRSSLEETRNVLQNIHDIKKWVEV